MVNLIFRIIDLMTIVIKFLIYNIIGLVKIVFCSTTQQKITMVLMFLVIYVDIVCFYPLGAILIHVFVLFLPCIYLYILGRSRS
jgi:hypothetical protein